MIFCGEERKSTGTRRSRRLFLSTLAALAGETGIKRKRVKGEESVSAQYGNAQQLKSISIERRGGAGGVYIWPERSAGNVYAGDQRRILRVCNLY